MAKLDIKLANVYSIINSNFKSYLFYWTEVISVATV